jgi:ankyrin repeat protein
MAGERCMWLQGTGSQRALEIRNLLMSTGIMSLIIEQVFRGSNVLHIAAFFRQPSVIRVLIDKQSIPDIDIRNGDGLTALYIAATYGDCVSIKMLLEAGANIDADCAGGRAIFGAVYSGKHDAVQLLLENQCSLLPNSDGLTPRLAALKYDHQALFALFTDAETKDGKF